MNVKAVILAGGKGTRLGRLSQRIPKPMMKVGDAPLLEHQIRLLKKYCIEQVVLITGHLSHVIKNYFADGSRFGIRIDYLEEKKPLGTAGGIKELEDELTADFFVFYGDVMINMNLEKLMSFHRSRESACTLVLHPGDHPQDSDLVEVGKNHRIVRFHSKPHPKDRYFRNLVSAGLYIMSPRMLRYLKKNIKADFGRDIFPQIITKERLYGYITPEYLKDIGTPARLKQVRKDYTDGKIEKLADGNKRPAIFLDRDGVINKKKGLIYQTKDFELLDGTAEAIKKINESPFLSIVVTNQPVIARNLCTIEQLEEIHKKMDTLLGRGNAKLDAVYYCPHHPDKGFVGENAAYKVKCHCRKPGIGMIEKAQKEFNIDLSRSFFVGDSFRDVLCGKNAGLTTIGLMTGDGCKDGDIEPDFFFGNLSEAIDFIIENLCRPF